jgi:hypothetical protein
MGIEKEVLPILIVALLTWGGVFLYLLRLDNLTRELEKLVHHRGAETQREDQESFRESVANEV